MGEELAKALENKVAFTIPLFGGISVNESVVVTWIIMGVIMLLVLLCLFLLLRIHRRLLPELFRQDFNHLFFQIDIKRQLTDKGEQL